MSSDVDIYHNRASPCECGLPPECRPFHPWLPVLRGYSAILAEKLK